MHEVELLADAVVIRTLVRLGIDPKRLISALLKIERYNAMLTLPDPDVSTHPGPRRPPPFSGRVIGFIRP